jgi:hypothetical protein
LADIPRVFRGFRRALAAGILFAYIVRDSTWAAGATFVARRRLTIHLTHSNLPRSNLVETCCRCCFGRSSPHKRGISMYAYTRSRRTLELKRPHFSVKPADGETPLDYDTRRVATHLLEAHAVMARELTLDDFGGRSDALGG